MARVKRNKKYLKDVQHSLEPGTYTGRIVEDDSGVHRWVNVNYEPITRRHISIQTQQDNHERLAYQQRSNRTWAEREFRDMMRRNARALRKHIESRAEQPRRFRGIQDWIPNTNGDDVAHAWADQSPTDNNRINRTLRLAENYGAGIEAIENMRSDVADAWRYNYYVADNISPS
jgi:hypothetical protein